MDATVSSICERDPTELARQNNLGWHFWHLLTARFLKKKKKKKTLYGLRLNEKHKKGHWRFYQGSWFGGCEGRKWYLQFSFILFEKALNEYFYDRLIFIKIRF
jgi:hypothetical protein